ncbi:MAG: T9SS type A sorting domain-containing protein, partial [Hymenobacter sp.]
NTQSGTTTYRAEQFEGDPGQNVAGSDLARVSRASWFTITPFSGTTVTQPSGFGGTLGVPFASGDGITDPSAATLVVAKRPDATQPWVNAGRSAATGTAAGGMLTSAPFTSFSDFALASTSSSATVNPLPVTLISFNAVRQANGTVQVAWATASEQHSAYFEVQRSLDGRVFTSAGQVLASGTTTQAHHYTSIDNTAPTGQLYYRLRQVDADNTATYSPTATLAGCTPQLALYPNPAQDHLTIALAAGKTVQLFDLAGYLLQTTTLPASGYLHVGTLPAGTYLLRVVLPEQVLTLRFTKE